MNIGEIIKAKRDIAYDFENYGIDFKQEYVYEAVKDKGEYYIKYTENGSGVWINDEDIQNVISHLDKNKNDRLEFEEFKVFIVDLLQSVANN